MHGGAGVVQKGKLEQIVFVVEGPETGASIAAVTGKECPVLASLSLVNFKSMTDVILSYCPRKVILAADNDGTKDNIKNILKDHFVQLKKSIQEKNSNIDVQLIMPDLVNNSLHDKRTSSDWNDVLVLDGIQTLKEQLWRKVNEP